MELNNKKILVTFLMHLGDLTLTTPFIHALKKAAPDSSITMLVDAKLKEVVLHNPYLDEVIAIDKKGKDNSILAICSMSRYLSKMNFDMVINLHPNERCSFLCAMVSTKERVGTTHKLFKPFWDIYIPLDRSLHATDMYLDVLTKLGVTNLEHNGLEIFTSAEAKENVNKFWEKEAVVPKDKLIGFNIGSAVLTKRWAPERFAAVADALAEKGYKTVFFGGLMDLELVKEAVSFMKSKPIVATGEFSLEELAAAMKRCEIIITNDSGPMHVAISQKVPIVAMYGPSNPKLYGPYTKDAIIVTAEPPCKGCASGMKHKCDDMQCMRNLTVEQVLAACDKYLSK